MPSPRKTKLRFLRHRAQKVVEALQGCGSQCLWAILQAEQILLRSIHVALLHRLSKNEVTECLTSRKGRLPAGDFDNFAKRCHLVIGVT
jgi:hypothetical protein